MEDLDRLADQLSQGNGAIGCLPLHHRGACVGMVFRRGFVFLQQLLDLEVDSVVVFAMDRYQRAMPLGRGKNAKKLPVIEVQRVVGQEDFEAPES